MVKLTKINFVKYALSYHRLIKMWNFLIIKILKSCAFKKFLFH